jgi:TPP-dependent pyruvate/acetoin dehydrogenase alpha subunit
LNDAETDAIDREVGELIEDAVRYAENSPMPGADTVLEDMYA